LTRETFVPSALATSESTVAMRIFRPASERLSHSATAIPVTAASAISTSRQTGSCSPKSVTADVIGRST
jgi:hypothetical protein